jgi:hypothetical protein
MHDTPERDTAPPDAAAGREMRDISTRVVMIFAASMVVGAVLLNVTVWLIFLHFGSLAARASTREYPLAHVGAPVEPPAPRLQARPREDLKRMRAEEDQVLDSYGWVDAGTGVVRIPIHQAMQRTVEQGLPARTDSTGFAPAGRPERSSSGRILAPPER